MAKKARVTKKKKAKAVARKKTDANEIPSRPKKKVSTKRLKSIDEAEEAPIAAPKAEKKGKKVAKKKKKAAAKKVVKKAKKTTKKKASAKAKIKPAAQKAAVTAPKAIPAKIWKSAAKAPPGIRAKASPKLAKKATPAEVLAEKEAILKKLKAEEVEIVEVPEPEPEPMVFVDRGLPLPDTYGYDRLVAMFRDPQWLFCYWELSGGVLDHVKHDHGQNILEEAAWVLRLHRVNEELAVDLEIDPSIGNWYLHVGDAGAYQLELGLLTCEGDWISLVASQVLNPPAESQSDILDEHWRLRPEDERKMQALLMEEFGLAAIKSQHQRSSRFKGASEFRLPTSGILSSSFEGASWSGGLVSSFTVSGSWSAAFLGASDRPSSPGSGGFMDAAWIVNADGRHQPLLIRPTNNGGPNWHLQGYLPRSTGSKTDAPHFKVKLPRVVRGVKRPRPSWPPVTPDTRPVNRVIGAGMPKPAPTLPERPKARVRLKPPRPSGSGQSRTA